MRLNEGPKIAELPDGLRPPTARQWIERLRSPARGNAPDRQSIDIVKTKFHLTRLKWYALEHVVRDVLKQKSFDRIRLRAPINKTQTQ